MSGCKGERERGRDRPDFSNQSAENENDISIGLASKVPVEQTLYNKIL